MTMDKNKCWNCIKRKKDFCTFYERELIDIEECNFGDD